MEDKKVDVETFSPPENHFKEVERLRILLGLKILDTKPEEKFDRYTRIGKALLGVEHCLISLVDAERQWFKSDAGNIGCSETSRGVSFCGHAINQQGRILLVEDASSSQIFKGNPLVVDGPKIRFYLGVKIRDKATSLPLGTLCGISSSPMSPTDEKINSMIELANCVEADIANMQYASCDPLTGLSNRRAFFSFANQLINIAASAHHCLIFLYFDLNRLKFVNDSYGHEAGDFFIKHFASALQASVRSGSHCDVPTRLSGDEFAVILIAENPNGLVRILLERLDVNLSKSSKKFKDTFSINVDITCSAGSSQSMPVYSADDISIPALLNQAEAHMRASKSTLKHNAMSEQEPSPCIQHVTWLDTSS
ncbi:sensor domain-containing diguanylate cyclase [Cyanobium sp. T1G-Tous]|uniref:sensor domain-containing diguanylate cyclase n=1 Tax=unclassified Cyanobium TaxID=2627006 RepID=UPI0020CBED4B|nr:MULTISPECIES: sensor domain-containing diguanylate cyclase [unclassified Cyanobium]MCP9803478.1 sensor domain-containing diguanylate cyclase [Cyanobium sp. T1G-Tous]MCP9806904.1 sensor domain-containing diguanylate cyclase [Cyanobium sp. T1B-Tous]MCP9875801.1 sensor domain-containing diguanylate cyclase [Cyanobium sp. A2C-AMD]